MARTPLLAGNWKMHGTIAATRALIAELRKALDGVKGRDVAIAPPFTALPAAADALGGSPILLAAQNVHGEPKGAFTGEISAEMLVEIGCRAVIVGHSERRQLFGETDAGVNQRTKAALAAGLLPIVCVGETLAEREAEQTLVVVRRQVEGALLHFDAAAIRRVCIAYEPVWAIGTGRTATPAQAEEVHAAIRAVLTSCADRPTADSVRILYGGSVKPDNVDDLMREPDIDGALVGGASLDAASFARIVDFRS